MNKLWKRLFGLAAIGSAAAGIFYYFKKTKADDEDDFDDDFDDLVFRLKILEGSRED